MWKTIQTNDSLIQTFLFLKIAYIFCYLRQVNIKVHVRQMHFCYLCSTGSKNHIEERGCANRNSVNTICNNVKRNIPTEDITCLACETDFCNGSSRHETTTTVLCFMSLSFVLIKIFAPVTWRHQLLQPSRQELYPELYVSNKLIHDIRNFLDNTRGDQFVMKSPPLPSPQVIPPSPPRLLTTLNTMIALRAPTHGIRTVNVTYW